MTRKLYKSINGVLTGYMRASVADYDMKAQRWNLARIEFVGYAPKDAIPIVLFDERWDADVLMYIHVRTWFGSAVTPLNNSVIDALTRAMAQHDLYKLKGEKK